MSHVDWVLIRKLAELSGYTVKALEKKIETGVWTEGRHYRRAPDGHLHVNVKEYDKWVQGGMT